jgi:membrane protease YdiL (CAAX protease family)
MVALAGKASSRSAVIVQMFVVLFTIECALWTQGRTQVCCFVAAFVSIVVCVLLSRPRVKDLGIGMKGMIGASVSIPIALAAAFLGVLFAWQIGTLRGLFGSQTPLWHALLYAVWAFEQQFILNSFFYRRFEHLFGDTIVSMLSAALLFSLVHLPNPVLVPATFIGGMFFISVFRRWRNIYPLAIAHAILGLTLAVTFPDHWLRHMRVGLAFLTFHANG